MAGVSLADLEIVRLDLAVHDVSGFDCGDSDLNDFLKTDATNYQADHVSHTRLAFLNRELVGYVTLLADCIILKTSEKKRLLDKLLLSHQTVFTFPALKIGRLGVQSGFQRSGIGRQLLKYVIGLVVRLNDEFGIGCRFITVDAYPRSIPWYTKHGFVANKHYADLGKANPSMRFDILKGPQID